MRKDPDLWHVDPKHVGRLHAPHIVADYVPQVSQPSSWQVHTSLVDRAALTDANPSTIASSTDDHRLGESILIDLGCVCHFQVVRQIHPPSGGQPPRFRVDTAGIRGFPYTLQFLGSGQSLETLAIFERPTHARFIRITVIEDSADPWLVSELEVE
jgi:hypothetical protein